MSGRILLVRHPPVPKAWTGRCYGSSDMGWSRAGAAMARALTHALAAEPAATIVHSGLRRTERLAAAIAARTGARLMRDDRWRERDFGSWEGRTWEAIWRETGDLMDRMLTHPKDFRPGGGETTAELLDRVASAWIGLPSYGSTIVIGHGGSIAAARVYRSSLSLDDLAPSIPPLGTVHILER